MHLCLTLFYRLNLLIAAELVYINLLDRTNQGRFLVNLVRIVAYS